MIYDAHWFFCINEREGGKKSCGNSGSLEIFEHAKKRIQSLGLNVRVNRSGCLGQCAKGPTLVIYPRGTWYHCPDIETVEKIIEAELVEQKTAEAHLL